MTCVAFSWLKQVTAYLTAERLGTTIFPCAQKDSEKACWHSHLPQFLKHIQCEPLHPKAPDRAKLFPITDAFSLWHELKKKDLYFVNL